MYFGDKLNAASKDKFRKLMTMLGTADSDMQPEVDDFSDNRLFIFISFYFNFILRICIQYTLYRN